MGNKIQGCNVESPKTCSWERMPTFTFARVPNLNRLTLGSISFTALQQVPTQTSAPWKANLRQLNIAWTNRKKRTQRSGSEKTSCPWRATCQPPPAGNWGNGRGRRRMPSAPELAWNKVGKKLNQTCSSSSSAKYFPKCPEATRNKTWRCQNVEPSIIFGNIGSG